MRKNVLMVILLILVSFLSVSRAEARHFKVYGYQGPKAGGLELLYWTDYIVSSDHPAPFFGKTVDREGLFSHTLEIEYGVTDRFTLAGYLDFEQPSGERFEYVQWRAVFARYRFFERGERFFDTALYLEYHLPDPDWQGESHEKIEARLILEKQIGPAVLRLNPILEKAVSGHSVEEGLEFEYGASLYMAITPLIHPGIELYGSPGEVGNFKSLGDQEYYIVPAVTWKIFSHIAWNVGVAFGLTDASDDLVIKSIIEIGL